MVKKKKEWYVYIVECLDGSYYTGITNDIDKRMEKHKKGDGSKYVRARGFNGLLIHKKCRNKSEACKVEYKIKQLPREEKLDFLNDF